MNFPQERVNASKLLLKKEQYVANQYLTTIIRTLVEYVRNKVLNIIWLV